MNFLRSALILATFTFGAFAADITGTWKAVFLGPQDQLPKTVAEMTFNLDANGNQLAGMAHMGGWPGDALIEDGKIDGDSISFTAVGKLPWSSSSREGEASGYPRLRFKGTVQGKELKLTVLWDSVMIYGRPSEVREYEMQGKKTSD
jgi:hypothetical protein